MQLPHLVILNQNTAPDAVNENDPNCYGGNILDQETPELFNSKQVVSRLDLLASFPDAPDPTNENSNEERAD